MNRLKHPLLFKLSGAFIALFILVAYAQDNGLQRLKLKGKVKLYTYHDYQVKGAPNAPIMMAMRQGEIEFNEDGNSINQDIYKRKRDTSGRHPKDGSYKPNYRFDTIHHTYNDSSAKPYHRPDTIKHYTYKDSKWVNKFLDSVQNVSHFAEQVNGAYWAVSFNFYDRKGNKIESRSVNIYGIIRIMKYNKMGEIKEHSSYSPKGNEIMSERNKNFWDKNGNTKSYYYINNILKEVSIQKFTYDKVGNWLIDSIFTNDTLTYIKKQDFEYW